MFWLRDQNILFTGNARSPGNQFAQVLDPSDQFNGPAFLGCCDQRTSTPAEIFSPETFIHTSAASSETQSPVVSRTASFSRTILSRAIFSRLV